MKKALRLPLVLLVLVALASVFALHAAAGTPTHVRLAGQVAAADSLPFKGTLEGRHISRTPLDPPFVLDRFEAVGQATQLGHFALVIEATVDFGSRPVTGAGTYTFTAANGDQLVADVTGFSALVRPGIVLITEHAIVDPNRSTGRFAGAEGAFTVERLADAATGVGGLTVGPFEGTISLPRAGEPSRADGIGGRNWPPDHAAKPCRHLKTALTGYQQDRVVRPRDDLAFRRL
ncbi:MAG: hypothetical protein ACJ77E_00895 [Gaiellaceae bacterium]